MRSRCGSKSTRRFSVQLTLKPQTSQAVDECFQLRRRVTKTRRGTKYDSIGPLCIVWCWSSVLRDHPLAALLPPGNFRHHCRRNDIRNPAEADLSPSLTGSFTDGLSKRFDGAVTRVKHHQDFCVGLWHR